MNATFITPVQSIGFKIPMSPYIVDKCSVRFENLAEVSADDINVLVKHIGMWQPHPVAAVTVPNITLLFLIVRGLDNMHLWVVVQYRKVLIVRSN